MEADLKNKNKANSPLAMFLHLVAFLSLGFLVFGTGSIVFQWINKYVFDPVSVGGFFDQGAVRFGIASLLVAGPIFFGVSFLIGRHISEGKIKEDALARRGLVFFVLFVAAAVIIGDLVALIFNFLEGELATRFFLKSLTILILSGAVFGYYLWEIRSRTEESFFRRSPARKKIAFSAVAVFSLVFFSAFFLVDSPNVAREKKVDAQKLSAVQEISFLTERFWERKDFLPENIDQLQSEFPFQTIYEIEYRKTGERSFELCAQFSHPSFVRERPTGGIVMDEWDYSSGRNCFKRAVSESSGVPGKISPSQ